MIFIKLTIYHSTSNSVHGKTTYVNPLLIVEMISHASKNSRGENAKLPYTERPDENYTQISFCAAYHEDVVQTLVQETPEQIIELIKKEMEK